jgi:hypothetical protein
MKRHILLIGTMLSIILFAISTTYYLGGSQKDKNAVGYDWRHNYICNLVSEKAVNGADNTATRVWAITGMLCLCVSLSLFFVRFADKIPVIKSANIIKYGGIGSMIFGFFVFTPYHNLMTTLSSIAALVALFYMVIYIFKSKRTVFKWLSVSCLAVLYLNNYIYYSLNFLEYLPVLQKISFVIVLALILGLDYFMVKEDFLA